jgi:hypothetical protein
VRKASSTGYRTLKWVLTVAFSALGLAVLAGILIPILFKDEIHQKVKTEINKKLVATVNYSDVGLSVFSNFPYLTFCLNDLSVAGKADFSGDTLLSLKELQLAVNIMDVVKGNKIDIRKVILDQPKIYAKVLKNGKPNWDIVADTTQDTTKKDTTPSQFALRLNKLKIIDAQIVFDDRSGDQLASIQQLNFDCSGDMSANNYDLDTETKIASLTYKQGGNTMVNKLAFEADAQFQIDNQKSQYSFIKNKFKFNALEIGIDGFVQMPKDSSIVMDLKFQAMETEFKNILSLVPGMYTQSFKDLKTDGTFALNGQAKGRYFKTEYPTFNVDLKINNGYFKYPDLPAPVKNILVDFKASNSTNNLDNMELLLKKFHAEFENNPIDASVLVTNIKDPVLDGMVKAKLQLGKLSRIFPIQDFELNGDLSLNTTFKGQVTKDRLPTFQAQADLKYGYIKYKEFPSAMENMTVSLAAENPTGDVKDTWIKVNNFHTEIDKEPIDAKLDLKNLDAPEYHLILKGQLDLAKILRIIPIEGTRMTGKVIADVDNKASMAQIEQKDYENIATSGSIRLENFNYQSKEVAQKVIVSKANLAFSNQILNLTEFAGTLGSSDVQMNGILENYIQYLFRDQTIKGNLNFNSNRFNANEWMAEDVASTSDSSKQTAPQPTDTTTIEAFEVPKNVDFLLKTSINELIYTNLTLHQFTGDVLVRDQRIELQGCKFKLFGGNFSLKGGYDSKDIKKPAYDMNFKIDSLDIPEAFKAFNTVKKLAPIAQHAIGRFTGVMNMSGILAPNMTPVYESINADGDLKLFNLKIEDVPLLNKVSEATKMDNLKTVQIRNTAIAFFIRDGRLHIKPFNFKVGNSVATVNGSSGLDQSIDYDWNFDIPAAGVSTRISEGFSQFTNQNVPVAEQLSIGLRVGGTYPKPTVSAVSLNGNPLADLKTRVKDQVKAKIDEGKERIKDEVNQKKKEAEAELNRRKKELEDKAKSEFDQKKQQAEEEKRKLQEKANQEAERKRKEAEEKLKQEQERLRQEKEKAEQRLKEETERKKKEAEEKLKEKFKFPR